ncbi:MAG TPA: pseudouridine synthase, partial [Nevskiaceae bacterium]|nr:pseudouridine synthase [Nevskiaceae bacterium]
VYEALAPALPHIEFPVTRRSRIVAGEPFFRQCEVPGEPNSETLIERIDVRGDLTLYRLQPHTGRTHQLRVHLAALGAPIVNDDFYPELRMAAEDDFSRPLQLLARSIEFNDPLTGAPRHFASARRLTLEGG